MVLTVAPGGTWLLWLLSLRRTPWAAVFAALAGGWTVGAIAGGLAASVDSHISLAALLGIATAFLAIPVLCAGIVESDVAQGIGAAADWRDCTAYPRRWIVQSQMSGDRRAACVYLIGPEGGRKDMGMADPTTDMDGYMELQARAEQAADTLNALKVGE